MRASSISGLLRRAHRASVALYDRHNADGVTAPQFEVLSALIHNGPLTQTALTNLAAVDRSSLSALMKGLFSDGLVAKCRHEKDQRAVIVTITPAGREALRKAEKAHLATERDILKALGGGKRPLTEALRAIGEITID